MKINKTSPASHFVPLRLALRGYLVALLPRRFALAFSVASLPQSFRNLSHFAPSGFTLCARILGSFALSGFALCARYLPHDSPRVPRSVHAKFHHDRIKTMGARGPMTDYAPCGVAQTPSGKAQPYLPHDTSRVPRSVHAKFNHCETHRNAKKLFYPYDRLRAERRSANPKRRSATLPTP